MKKSYEIINQLISVHNYSKNDIAEYVGVTRKTISLWHGNERTPSEQHYMKLVQLQKEVYASYNDNILDGIKKKSYKDSVILVAENHISSASGLQQILEWIDIKTEVCHSGLKSIELALKNNYQVIIMDIGFSDVSGIDAARAIRAVKPKQVIFSCSGHYEYNEEEKKLFNEDIPKPIMYKQKLFPKLKKYIYGIKV